MKIDILTVPTGALSGTISSINLVEETAEWTLHSSRTAISYRPVSSWPHFSTIKDMDMGAQMSSTLPLPTNNGTFRVYRRRSVSAFPHTALGFSNHMPGADPGVGRECEGARLTDGLRGCGGE